MLLVNLSVQDDPGLCLSVIANTWFVHILENMENIGILEFDTLNILEFCQRFWKRLEYDYMSLFLVRLIVMCVLIFF